jgi:lysophospholipase L1-like esterase
MRTRRTPGRAVWFSLTALVALSVLPAAAPAAAAPRLSAVTSNQSAGTSSGALQLNKVLNDGGSGFTGPFTMTYDCTLSGSPEITGAVTVLASGSTEGSGPSGDIPAGYVCTVSEPILAMPAPPADYSWATPVITGSPATIIAGALVPVTVTNTLIKASRSYVALGDSYSSGNGTPDESGVCVRSPGEAWPTLVPGIANPMLPAARMVSSNVALLACSGATSTGTSVSPGEEDLPAQITQLTSLQTPGPPTSIVTVTMGGDDGKDQGVGFLHTLLQCYLVNCVEAFRLELKWLKNQEPALLRQDFTSIMAAAPSATVFAVGYPLLFNPQQGYCVGLSPVDQKLLNLLTSQLDADIQTAAASVPGVTYVNVLNAFSGQQLCPPPNVSSDVVAPFTLQPLHDWFHPNPTGQEQIANLVAAAIVASQ